MGHCDITSGCGSGSESGFKTYINARNIKKRRISYYKDVVICTALKIWF